MQVDTLSGSGSIQANGGASSDRGGGGGGRIAVYAADYSAFNTTNLTAAGGTGNLAGGAGTVWLRDTDEAQGTLFVSEPAGGTGWAVLGLPGTNVAVIAGGLTVRGSSARVRPEHEGMRIEVTGDLVVEDSGCLETDSQVVVAGQVRVARGGFYQGTGSTAAGGPVTVDGGTFSGGALSGLSLLITNSGLMTSPTSTTTQVHKLEIDVSGAVTVDATSRIDVSGKGYLAGRTTGNTTEGGATGYSGGSYGGLGGNSGGAPNAVYGDYHFVLSQTLLDAEGFELDQNANGIPGEPEDAFSFTLILDTVPPRITQQSPAGDIAGTLGSIDVWFSERIDTTTLSAGDVVILGPATNTIPVTAIQEVGLNRFRFSVAAQTAVGLYTIQVGPNITDLAGNLLNQDGDATFGEPGEDSYAGAVNLVDFDLEVTSVTPSASQFWAGDAVSVSWSGRNVTGAPLLGSWTDGVYLSPDPFWNITDIRVATVTHTGGLATNEVYTTNATFSVPGLLPANYRIIVRADIANTAVETVEANNVAASDPVSLAYRTFTAGGPAITGTLTAANRLHYYAIQVPAGESLRLNLTSPSGVNHLFVNLASIPTRQDSDFSGRERSANQVITLTGIPGGATY